MNIKFQFPGSTTIHSGTTLSLLWCNKDYIVKGYKVRMAGDKNTVVHKSWIL